MLLVRVIISIMILNIISVMAVKTSGCSGILFNDWAASRSQPMQGPKSLQLKSYLLIRRILIIKRLKLYAIHKILNLNTKTCVNHKGNTLKKNNKTPNVYDFKGLKHLTVLSELVMTDFSICRAIVSLLSPTSS